ncbi:MAG: DUF6444 domain-containing protein [Nannocystaceae bacterium]
MAKLRKQVQELLGWLGKNPLNSSLPPSRDNAQARAGRTRKTRINASVGVRKGTNGYCGRWCIDHVPTHCSHCKSSLKGEDSSPRRRFGRRSLNIVCTHWSAESTHPSSDGRKTATGPGVSRLESILWQ